MEQEKFDPAFQSITKEMVEIAFELVDFNKNETDIIFIIGSIEDSMINYKIFYSVNNNISRVMDLNKYSQVQYNLSDERVYSLMRFGNTEMKKLRNLFIEFNREIPTLIKIKFWPKTGKFECQLSYDLQYSYEEGRGFHNVFSEWFDEEGNYLTKQ